MLADWSSELRCRIRMNRHAQPQRDALSDRCDPSLHPRVCSLPAELPAHRGEHGRARRFGRPFVDQPVGDSFSAAHREDGPKHKRPVGRSWRMDETYIKVKGVWKYVYRAVDKQGKTVDFLLTAKRDMAAAKRFFDTAIGANGDPDKVAMDKSGADKGPSMRSTPTAPCRSLSARLNTSTTLSSRIIAPSSG